MKVHSYKFSNNGFKMTSLLLVVSFVSVGCTYSKRIDHITNEESKKEIDEEDISKKLYCQLSHQQHFELSALSNYLIGNSEKSLSSKTNQQISLQEFQELVNIATDLDNNFKIDDNKATEVTIDNIKQTIVNSLDILIKIKKYLHSKDPAGLGLNERQIQLINEFEGYFASLIYNTKKGIGFDIQSLQADRLIKGSDIKKLQEHELIEGAKIFIPFKKLVVKYYPELKNNIGEGPLPPKYTWPYLLNLCEAIRIIKVGRHDFEPWHWDKLEKWVKKSNRWDPKPIPNKDGHKVFRGCQPYKEKHINNLLKDLGIKHIINLKRESTDNEYFVNLNGITTHWIPIFDEYIPSEDQCAYFLDLISKIQKEGVYIHCQEGKGRTGVFSGIYAYDHSTREEYFEQIKTVFSPHQRKFLDYKGWKKWEQCRVSKL